MEKLLKKVISTKKSYTILMILREKIYRWNYSPQVFTSQLVCFPGEAF